MVLEKLNVSDEIINGNPRYNITDNADGTKNIELANEIINQGTALNKLLFDKVDNGFNKIDNVLEYLIPNVSQEITTETYQGNIITRDISPTWTSTGLLNTKVITENLTIFNNIEPILTYETTASEGFIVSNSSHQNNRVPIYGKWGSNPTPYQSNIIMMLGQRTSYSDMYTLYFYPYGDLSIIWDMKVKCKPTFNYYMYGNPAYIEGSNDKETWTRLSTAKVDNTATTYTPITSYRYYRFYQPTAMAYISYLYVSKVVYDTIINKYVLDNNGNFINNQRVLIQIDNEVPIPTGNTLNGINIDSILIPGKYYELLYNSSQNKFIAQEVRN